MTTRFDRIVEDNAWCPGCGNFSILAHLKEALEEMGLDPLQSAVVSGIGQAAKTPQYMSVNMFNGLHGRALPVAQGLKVSNPSLTVIAEGGDGDMYGEGGNHFMAAIRRNATIINIVHNNMVYGLTKGQASPTSQRGFKTPVQTEGVHVEPFNPIATAISLDASLVIRTFSGNKEHCKAMLKIAIEHKGYVLIDIFQPCVTFNKTNTFKWFKDNVYELQDDYDPTDKVKAFEKALESHPFPIGVIYKGPPKVILEDALRDESRVGDKPLYSSTVDYQRLGIEMEKYI
ncbi:MAG: thiamine pyrophosphate-dependent enzyme [Sulfuricurvum sp.]|uniref:thiamine pyrophosphate-dependent enzyme n=1 Tax=Sulfuricurvum sp. TaxID=2025608 RepID=UPI00261F1FE4|nr:thiamine pyrophosphate-dependent enzyme [Sulfuricurvum sp.]MDD2951015.1 thiamine pyrophosphate-dependent enzyme [Sulfuricurvum sp.]MDD5119612.1 thiamine pyrophosphate-dependent enzyme [Sulfuricurvum sp.]